jgi:hypothetical protein
MDTQLYDTELRNWTIEILSNYFSKYEAYGSMEGDTV